MSRARAAVLFVLGIAWLAVFDRVAPFAEPLPGARSWMLITALGFLSAVPHSGEGSKAMPGPLVLAGLAAPVALALAVDVRAGFAPREPLQLAVWAVVPWLVLGGLARGFRAQTPRRVIGWAFFLLAFGIPAVVAADALDGRLGRAASLQRISLLHRSFLAWQDASARGDSAGEAFVRPVKFEAVGPLAGWSVWAPQAPATWVPEPLEAGELRQLSVPVAFREGLEAATQLAGLQFEIAEGGTGSVRALGLGPGVSSAAPELFDRGRPAVGGPARPIGPGPLAIGALACGLVLWAGWSRRGLGASLGVALLAVGAVLGVAASVAEPGASARENWIGELSESADGSVDALWVAAARGSLGTGDEPVRLAWRAGWALPRLEVTELVRSRDGGELEVGGVRVEGAGADLWLFEVADPQDLQARLRRADVRATRDPRGAWSFHEPDAKLPPFLLGGLPLGRSVTVAREPEGGWLRRVAPAPKGESEAGPTGR